MLVPKAKKEEALKILKIVYPVPAKTKVLGYSFKTIREYINEILATLEIGPSFS